MKRTALRRRTPLARGGRLRPVSPKRRAERAARARVVELAHARDGHRCVARDLVPHVACAGRLDADERINRKAWPGGHLVLDNVQSLCRAHHEWKHTHPIQAHDLGLSGWSWEIPEEAS